MSMPHRNGDLVIGTRSTHPTIGRGVLCIVRSTTRWNGRMKVEIVGGSKYYSDRCYHVSQGEFDDCTVDQYHSMYPNAIIDYAKLGYYQDDGDKDYFMDMSADCEITDEEKERLADEVLDYLHKNNYGMATKSAAMKIVEKWAINKAWIIAIFKKHPNYNGKYQIVFDEDYQRKFDKETVSDFGSWISYNRLSVLKGNEVKITAFTYREVTKILAKINDTIDYFYDIKSDLRMNALIGGKSPEEYIMEKLYFERIAEKYNKKILSGEFVRWNNDVYNADAYRIFENLDRLTRLLRNLERSNIDENDANEINKLFDVKAVAGQKLSRVINKIMAYTGLADMPDYNKAFSKYSDAVNPLKITRHTLLSVHPIDYLTMSNGNSWTSCHSVRNRGQYHSGTMSYMLDRSSFVYYTVDKSYDGNKYEEQPKIVRCMFHMGYEKLVQGRVYPQSTDGDESVYLEVRNIVRRVLANCMGIKDDWTIQRGSSSCTKEIDSKGTHYKDYTNTSRCNVSRIKREDGFSSNKQIVVGHSPICVKCGSSHNGHSTLKCNRC